MSGPIGSVLVNGVPVSKSDFRTYFDQRIRLRMVDVDEVVNTDLTGVFSIEIEGERFEFDSDDTTTAHDGVSVLVDSEGHRFKLLPGLFLALGGVINWGNGDVILTHSLNTLTFAGASLGYIFDAILKPSADDGAPLGASGAAFSDLFLAIGGVINWGAGDVTITHSANALAFAGASSGYSFDAKLQLSVPVTSAPQFSTSGVSYALAQNETLAIFTGNSGLVIVTDNTNGSTAAIVCGGGGVVILGQSSGSSFAATSTPTTAQTGVYFSGSMYLIKNGFVASHSYYVMSLGTRPSA